MRTAILLLIAATLAGGQGLNLGSGEASKVYLGGSEVAKVYLGSTEIDLGGSPPEPTNPGTTNLLAWWAMEDQTFADSNGNYDLTETGSIGTVTGKIGNAGHGTGSTSNYLKSSTFPQDLEASDFTIGYWVRALVTVNNMRTVARYGSTTATQHFGMSYNTSSDRPYMVIYGSPSSLSGSKENTMIINTWYFVVARRSGDDIQIYVDGAWGEVTDLSGLTENTGSADLELFRQGTAGALTGYLDEVFIYDKALTDDQVDWIYNTGTGRTYTDLTP